MFFFKGKILKCKKITFSIIEEYLVYFTGLIPEINKDGENVIINFKQKNRRTYLYLANQLLSLICGYDKRVKTIREASFAVKSIAQHTQLYDIMEMRKEIERKSKEKQEEEIETAKGEKIKKSDYINNYINSSYRNILEVINWTEKEFIDNVGFLDYEETLAILERKKLERSLAEISGLMLVASACFSKNTELEKYMKGLQKRIKELSEIGFDKKAFESDVMYGVGVENGEEV